MTVNVLGTEYTIETLNREDDGHLDSCDGYFDETVNKIVIVNSENVLIARMIYLPIIEKSQDTKLFMLSFMKAGFRLAVIGQITKNLLIG